MPFVNPRRVGPEFRSSYQSIEVSEALSLQHKVMGWSLRPYRVVLRTSDGRNWIICRSASEADIMADWQAALRDVGGALRDNGGVADSTVLERARALALGAVRRGAPRSSGASPGVRGAALGALAPEGAPDRSSTPGGGVRQRDTASSAAQPGPAQADPDGESAARGLGDSSGGAGAGAAESDDSGSSSSSSSDDEAPASDGAAVPGAPLTGDFASFAEDFWSGLRSAAQRARHRGFSGLDGCLPFVPDPSAHPPGSIAAIKAAEDRRSSLRNLAVLNGALLLLRLVSADAFLLLLLLCNLLGAYAYSRRKALVRLLLSRSVKKRRRIFGTWMQQRWGRSRAAAAAAPVADE